MINKNGSMGNRFFLFCSFILLACFSVQAQVSFGEAKFNENWLFSLSDDSLGASASYDDSKWRKLDLPHDWSVEGQLSPSLASCTGYLPGGIAGIGNIFRLPIRPHAIISILREHITAARFI